MEAFGAINRHRGVLYVVAALGFVGINGIFVVYGSGRPELMSAALENPVSLAFVVEAFLMVGLFAWLIARAGLRRPGWLAFVVMSLVGSLAFSVPAFLLWHGRKRGPE